MTGDARLVLGALLATAIAAAALRTRTLTRGGALAAIVCGTATSAAGWGWAAALIAFFVPATLLSRWRHSAKARATGDVIEKAGARDAWQVVANGGVITACAVAGLAWPGAGWAAAGLGAIASATADTWATEVGTAIGGTPWSVAGFTRVPPGTSGAVSVAGTLALLGGALLQGTVGLAAGFGLQVAVAIAAGGVTGALVDTALGATIQERRWCPTCARATEQRLHRCGTATRHAGGLAFMTNDAVNLTSTIAGGLAALAALALGR